MSKINYNIGDADGAGPGTVRSSSGAGELNNGGPGAPGVVFVELPRSDLQLLQDSLMLIDDALACVMEMKGIGGKTFANKLHAVFILGEKQLVREQRKNEAEEYARNHTL